MPVVSPTSKASYTASELIRIALFGRGRVLSRVWIWLSGGPARGLCGAVVVAAEDLGVAAGVHLRPGLAQRGDQPGRLLLGGGLQERRQRAGPGLGVLEDKRRAARVRRQVVGAVAVLPGDAACHRVPGSCPVGLVGATAGLEREHLLLGRLVDLDLGRSVRLEFLERRQAG